MIDPRPTRDAAVSLYVDMTTAYEEQGRIPHGTTRVERGLVGGLAALNLPNLRFCRYDRTHGRFLEVSPSEALRIATADTVREARRDPVPAWRLNPVLQAGKRIEKWVRQNIRNPFRAVRAKTFAQSPDDDQIFAAGATLLIPGELQRHDMAVLMGLKRRLALRLAFVFYDLLGLLPADDARLRDPDASDLPSSDFISREAALVLSISAYSRCTLLEHFVSRGVAAPPVHVIPLGHFLRPAPGSISPPAGLQAGEFVLTVGDIVPRKNHALLVEVWRAMIEGRVAGLRPLVIAGRVGTDGTHLANAILADSALNRWVMILSNADDATLDWLYANCLFTACPSLAEGYGLPVAESLAAGKVCVASSRTSVPEASQGLGIHLDPEDHAAWRTEIELLMTDADELRRQEKRIRGFRKVTWRDTAVDAVDFLMRSDDSE